MLRLPPEVLGPIVGIGSIVTIITAALILLRYAVYKIPGRSTARIDPARDQLLEELQLRVGELEEMKHRMIELEERLDFAERLLAKRPEAPGLLPAARPNTPTSRPITPV